MKKIKCILLIIIILLTPDTAHASEVHLLADFVFFDPVTTNTCNEKNYWTIYNQNTTCYRFVVLNDNDTASSNKIKIMLDHDIGTTTFENYKNILKTNTKTWKRYNGTIDIIDEQTIYKLMKLKGKPTLDNISVNGGITLGFFKTNTMYMLNKKIYNSYGYWSKDVYEKNPNYVYTVTEYASNRLVEKNKIRGVRPVIIADKSLLTKSSNITNIDSLVKNANHYKYKHSPKKYNNYYYKQLQGFTFTKNKLVFHASNNSTPNMGLIYTYSNQGYQTLYRLDYNKTAHGNDMTYNSKTNKVLVLVNKEIFEYNGDTLAYEKKYTINEKGNSLYSAIGYDEYNDYYYALTGRRVYVLNRNFEKLYSIDITALGIYQGLEYNNGYLYMTTFESTCPNRYQLYCFEENWSSITYVYNVKFKQDKTPTEDFGKLVDRLYVGSGIGELESISFNNKKMYLGYATQNTDPNYSFKFYEVLYGNDTYPPEYTIEYTNESTTKTITINSNEELKNIPGWNLSTNLHSLSKAFKENKPSSTLKVCDLYNNCTNIKLKELTFDKDNQIDSVNNNTSQITNNNHQNTNSGNIVVDTHYEEVPIKEEEFTQEIIEEQIEKPAIVKQKSTKKSAIQEINNKKIVNSSSAQLGYISLVLGVLLLLINNKLK